MVAVVVDVVVVVLVVVDVVVDVVVVVLLLCGGSWRIGSGRGSHRQTSQGKTLISAADSLVV